MTQEKFQTAVLEAITELREAIITLTGEIRAVKQELDKNHDDLTVIKTKMAISWGVLGVLGAALVAIAVEVIGRIIP